MIDGIQFGRYVEVEIRDFESKVKTVIGNEFEIQFDYFKTLDQTKEDDSGRILIYGLTEERIKTLQVSGGEVQLRCGYDRSQIDTLFIASIARVYSEISDNTSITTIECSANLLNYYRSSSVSSGGADKKSLSAFLFDISKSIGRVGIVLNLDNFGESEHQKVIEFFETYPIKNAYVGAAEEVLNLICNIFGLAMKKGEGEEYNKNVFTVTPLGVKTIKNFITKGYDRLPQAKKPSSNEVVFNATLLEDENSRVVAVLGDDTGLIDSKIEYKIATAYADQRLTADEEETLKSQQKRAKVVEKENEKIEKAKKKGKDYEKKVGTLRTTIQIDRKYNRVKALLNPLVKPQSTVSVQERVDTDMDLRGAGDLAYDKAVTYRLYRVRSATYKGNNKRDDWIMDLYCQDTDVEPLDAESLARLQQTVSPEDIQIENDLEGEFSEE